MWVREASRHLCRACAWCAHPGSVPGSPVPTRASIWAAAPSREIESSLDKANGPSSASSWHPRRPETVGLLRQNGRRVFPFPLCFPPTKGRVSVRAGLCSASWRPRRNLCQTGLGGPPRGSKGADLPLLPGSLPGHSFPFSPFPSRSSCAHSGSFSSRLPRKAAS